MEEPRLGQPNDTAPVTLDGASIGTRNARTATARTFETTFAALFAEQHTRLFRYIDRLSGDAEMAADCAQDAFVRLYHRGAMPATPNAWLLTVAMNLFRNARSARSRRLRLLTPERAARAHADTAPAADACIEHADVQPRVRHAMQQLPEREQQLLLLRAEGYRYREIAVALDINEASVGTLLARAQREFRRHYGERDATPG